MVRATEVEVISSETIKPSSPTSHHLKDFKLSLLDQIAPALYTSTLLFYQPNDENSGHVFKRSQLLKTSLSKTLTLFYPLAGRLMKHHDSVDCNDNGAEYVEARVNCRLTDILHQPDHIFLRKFLPVKIESTEAESGRLLFVQANFFECSGLAIGVSCSHKLTDASSLGTFIKSWAAIARDSEVAWLPEYVTATIFPPIHPPAPTTQMVVADSVTRRFVFDSTKITKLRAEAASASVQKPTRVEVVTALIWKCIKKMSRSSGEPPTLSVLGQAVNLRKRTVPPLSDNSFGNMVGCFAVGVMKSEILELQDLVSKLRNGMEEFRKNGLHALLKNKKYITLPEVENQETAEFYFCSSWCRFPFYEADFGWGKPTWVTIPHTMIKNSVMLLDARDSEGIEALITMSEEDMASFQRDLELQAFAASNPTI